jgi:hypothetical protein
MPERRKFQRTNVQKAAKIVAARCQQLIGCTVLNLSIGGAVIIVANAADVPNEFELTFDAARTMRLCRVAWRTEHKIGVAFC